MRLRGTPPGQQVQETVNAIDNLVDLGGDTTHTANAASAAAWMQFGESDALLFQRGARIASGSGSADNCNDCACRRTLQKLWSSKARDDLLCHLQGTPLLLEISRYLDESKTG